MRIDGLEIESFGPWQGLRLHGFSPELNVMFVSESAHQRAMVQFLQFALYGQVPPDLAGRVRPAATQGRVSGSLRFTTEHGARWLTRCRESYFDCCGQESLSVIPALDPPPPTVAEAPSELEGGSLVERALHGVGADEFRQWYVIDSQELPGRVDGAAAEDLSQRCYEFVVQGPGNNGMAPPQGASPPTCVPSDTLPQLKELVQRRERLDREIRDHRRVGRLHGKWIAVQRKLEQAVQRERKRLHAIRCRLQLIDVAKDFHAKGAHLSQWGEAITTMVPMQPSPATASRPNPSDQIDARIEAYRERIERIRKQRRQLRSHIRGLTFAAVHTTATRVQSLLDQAKWMLDAEVNVEQIDSRLQRLDDPETGDASHPPSPPVDQRWSTLRPAARALYAARRQLRRVRRDPAPEPGTDATAPPDPAPTADSAAPTDEMIRQASNRLSQLRRRVKLEDHVGQMRANRECLERECGELQRRQFLPVWALCLMGVILVGGIMSAVAGICLTSANWNPPWVLDPQWRWPLVLVGVTVSFTTALIHVTFGRLASDRLGATRRQMHVLTRQIDDALNEADALDIRLGTADASPPELLEQAERELLALQKQSAEAPRERDNGSHDASPPHRASAEKEYEAACQSWRDALTGQGLPSDLTPRDARAQLDAQSASRRDLPAEDASETAEPVQQLMRQRHQQAEMLAAWTRQCREVFEEIGQETPEETVSSLSRQLRETLCEHRDLKGRRKRLIHKHDRLRRQESRLCRTVERLADQRSLGKIDADRAEPRNAEDEAAWSRAKASLLQQRDAVERELQAITERAAADPWLTRILQRDDHDLEPLRRRYSTRLERRQARLERLLERQGRCRERLRQLGTDRRTAELRLQRAETTRQIQETSRRLQTEIVAGSVYQQAVQRREHGGNHRHPCLAHASSYLARLTEGELTRIGADDHERRLYAEDRQGTRTRLEDVGSAQRGLIWLSLRLARVRQLQELDIRLPVVLDDVLPESDDPAAERVCRLLCDFSRQGCQLLLLTRGRSHLALVRSLDVPVAELDGQVDRPIVLDPRRAADDGDRQPESPPSARWIPSVKEEPYHVLGPVPLRQAQDELRRLYASTSHTDNGGSTPARADEPTRGSLASPTRNRLSPPSEPEGAQDTGEPVRAVPQPEPAPPDGRETGRTPQTPDDELPEWWPD